ncbi:hypothetical protein SLH49_03760 [Cognatiyoonia sp. IB215446]|uniref:hypothetical protein n=1 Tax=Cognatiyoonia sp. IB215446 TaxID=3097355 RepID=UPI002A1821C1|nr:hypothetical protein [Cognatiyoonia sp. IB215446]MDX8347094.1 hypothetical protein [Cognatiyoonia sp. IB215446]
MRLLVAVICLLVTPQAAVSGAWAREEGQFFLSSGGNFLLSDGAQLPVHYDPTLYLEYGLTDILTIGVDYHTADQGRIDTGFVFARFPLGETTGATRYAASIGFGARVDEFNPRENLVQGGLFWGRGYSAGWFAVDFTATHGDLSENFRAKADFTWGHNLSDRWTTSLQLQTGEGFSGDTYAKINPAIIMTLTQNHRISLGAVRALTGDEGSALKLNVWSTF